MDTTKETKKSFKKDQKTEFITPVIKEHLKVLASVIVERIMEAQKNGTLRFKMQQNK